MDLKRTNSGGPMTIDTKTSGEAALKPWERQEGEDWIHYHAFTIFRDILSPKDRTDIALAKKLGRSAQTIANWRKKYKWQERTLAYLIFKDDEARVYDKYIRQEMNDRHAKICRDGLDKVIARLKDIDPTTLSNNELMKWLDTLIKNERLARGASTEIVNATQSVSGTVTVNNNENITHKVVVDADASKLACELLEKIELGQTLDSSPQTPVDMENKNE